MRALLILLLGISLLAVQGCTTKKQAACEYEKPYAVAIIMPAYLVNVEIDRSAYEGVEFPLFCGYGMVYPEENRFEFIPKTDLPIRWVRFRMEQTEKEGANWASAPLRLAVPVKDKEFYITLYKRMEGSYIRVYRIELDEKGIPKTVLQFSRMCPYDSKKDPPVECGYYHWDADKLLIK